MRGQDSHMTRDAVLPRVLTASILPLMALCWMVSPALAVEGASTGGGSEWLYLNVPLHSTLEIFGAFSAITVGFIIMLPRNRGQAVFHSQWISGGLIAMGALDVFHGASAPGNLFVWFHSVAVLTGGLFFSLVWFSDGSGRMKTVPLASAAGAVALGIFSVMFSDALPVMVAKGEFTFTADAVNMAGGLLFLAAAPSFYMSYAARRSADDLLFFFVCALSAVAGFLFEFSKPWGMSWWVWHVVRVGAFIIILWYMFALFRRSLTAMSESAKVISSTSAQIASTLAQHESVASQQAVTMNETSAAVEEIGAASRTTAEQAEISAETAKKTAKLSGDGVAAAKEAIGGMGGLKERMEKMADDIYELGEKTGQISGIASLVKDLSGEINMLALNASVEAVRAGERGKGFTVVANEVRKLADQTRKSAERVGSLVAEIQAAVNSAMVTTEDGVKKMEDATGLAVNVGEIFRGISETANAAYENAQRTMLSARQQSAALEQITQAINTVTAGTKETAAGIGQTKVGVEQLNKAAESLKRMT